MGHGLKPISIKGFLALVVCIHLLFAAPWISGVHASTCAKPGMIKVVAGTKFVCKTHKGKLTWIKQPKSFASTPTPTVRPSSSPTSTPSAKPTSSPSPSYEWADYGEACPVLKAVAVGRGADGSNLVCKVETSGTFQGQKIWAYPTFPVIRDLNLYVPGGAGGGYDTFGRELMRSMKAEGTLINDATFRNLSGAGGTTGLSAFLAGEKANASSGLVTGFAMVGGVAATKVPFRISDAVCGARMMGEWEVVVVPADSPYRTLGDLIVDIKAKRATLPIAGGNLGGIDHYTAVLIYEALGLSIKDLNYVVYSGGAQIAAALQNGSSKAAISSYGEFSSQIAAGDLRILGISSASKVPGINAPTLKSQKLDVVAGNWRGVMLPRGTSDANRNLIIRALDVTRQGNTWKSIMNTQRWADNWLVGDKFYSWLTEHEELTLELYRELGL